MKTMIREALSRRTTLGIVTVLAALTLLGCAGAPAAPTAKPAAEPPKAAAPVEPAKPAAAAPAAPAPAAPTAPAAAAPAAPTKAPEAAKKVDYPVKGKTLTWIVPTAAGGAGDLSTRVMAAAVEKELGIPVEVLNKPGASSQIGYTELVRSKPDGYTMAYVSLPTALASYVDPDMKAIYGRKDFQPVANYVVDPGVLAVQGNGPYKVAKDLVDAAKSAGPEKIVVASSNAKYTPAHLAIVLFEKAAGVKFGIVMYDGGGPATTALLGGHVAATSGTGGNFKAQVDSGALRLLGIMDKAESPFYSGIKTFEAQGYAVRMPLLFGAAVPAGTPPEIVSILSAAIKKATESPEAKQRLATSAFQVQYMDTTQFSAAWDDMEKTMAPVILDLIKASK